jgi:hypothetical protein
MSEPIFEQITPITPPVSSLESRISPENPLTESLKQLTSKIDQIFLIEKQGGSQPLPNPNLMKQTSFEHGIQNILVSWRKTASSLPKDENTQGYSVTTSFDEPSQRTSNKLVVYVEKDKPLRGRLTLITESLSD